MSGNFHVEWTENADSSYHDLEECHNEGDTWSCQRAFRKKTAQDRSELRLVKRTSR